MLRTISLTEKHDGLLTELYTKLGVTRSDAVRRAIEALAVVVGKPE